MLKRVVFALLMLSLLPTAAMADGVAFGFMGGTVGAVSSGSSFALTTVTLPTLEFVARLPNPPGPTYGGGSNFGTVSFTTGDYTGSSGASNYFGLGGSFVITANANFSAVTGGVVSTGATLFSGAFSDITTSSFLGPLTVPAGTPGGTGAIWTSIACPAGIVATSCSQLIASLSGQLDANLVSWLGLGNTNFANGWVAQINFTSTGSVYDINFGDTALYVPEPGTLFLFGTGLASIAGVLRRKMAV